VEWADGEKWVFDPVTDEALADVDFAMPAGDPPPAIWARLAKDLEAPHALEGGLVVNLFEDGRWRELAPGVRMKRMWDKRTFLLRCEPGSSVPAHEHRAFEHAVVISGDLVSNLGVYGPGDYHGVPTGGVHDAWTTRGGCVVLIQYDETA
jgi:anti-sigma factor ChrR (cupin superfamily)